MTRYIVHIYREMRLTVADIEADTPEAAAAITRDRPTGDADDIEDCEGETLSALVDMAGDEDYEQSRLIDFEAERHRKGAPKLLEALKAMDDAFSHYCEYRQQSDDETSALVRARATIAKAEAAGIRADSTPVKHPARFEIEHDPQENPDRAYVLVDGKFDVAIIRTDEGVVVDVYPKDGFETIATTYAFNSEVEHESSTN
jgi:hypothetical protein